MADAIRRDIEIRLRAVDDTAAGVNSASRNIARAGQAADRSGEIGLAPIRRAPGYSRLEQEVRDAQAAELRAIRVQTARAEMQARQEYARSIARENLGLSTGDVVAARAAAATAARATVARSGVSGLGGRALAFGNRLVGGRVLGPGGGLAAIAAAESVAGRALNVADNREERAKLGYSLGDDVKDAAQSLSPLPALGRVFRDAPEAVLGDYAEYAPLRMGQNAISRLTGSMTIAEERAARAEEAAIKKRLDAAEAEIDLAEERRKRAAATLSEMKRGRLSAAMGAQFDTAQSIEDFDGARVGKTLSEEEQKLRQELVRQAAEAREAGVFDKLTFERRREDGVRGYYADQQRQRAEREAEVADRQRRADEEMAAEAERERDRQAVLARRRNVMLATGRVEAAGEALGRAQSAYDFAEAAAPVRVSNDLTGDAGALFGIQSTGKDSSAAMLNRLAEEIGRQTTIFNQVLGELKQLRKVTEEQELL